MEKKHRSDLFMHVVNSLQYGGVAEDLSDALAECVSRAQATGKGATLTLTLAIQPQGNSGQYLIAEEVKKKLPAETRATTLMFGTPDGNLQREDPRQKSLELRPVDTATAPVREMAETRPAVREA